MNDPNGPIFLNGQYHLFFQLNPFGDQWGHMSWGHAVSPDLIHWKQLPMALAEENGVAIFSGSTVEDRENTSGLCGDAGQKTPDCLIAIYTGDSRGKADQNIAFSRDGGATLDKIRGESSDRSRPQGLSRSQSLLARAVAELGDGSFASRPAQASFLSLKEPSPMGVGQRIRPSGAVSGVWECPDLFELPVYDDSDKLAGSRWLLNVNISAGGPAGGSETNTSSASLTAFALSKTTPVQDPTGRIGARISTPRLRSRTCRRAKTAHGLAG